jgi:predicted TIM-barrel fold metal-dependent hydrolase
VTDAYCHLDMDAESPIADIEQRMSQAFVSRAFLIETWDGRNRYALKQTDKLAVALCYREGCRSELLQLMETAALTGIRMSTEDIRRNKEFCREMAASGMTLVAHAEAGIGALCRELMTLREMKLYVPHLAWPIRDGTTDDDWEPALKEFASMPFLRIGISAIAHFSSQPFPHDDIRDLALGLISRFPASRIAIGSDYPLFEKERYAGYIGLACDWVRVIHPKWKTEDNF